MNTELYIENYRLDITKEISALLNFAIDDIKDFSARSTTWSKTIVLPGTANNNKLFGHIFQVGQSNNYSSSTANVGSNFNAAKAAACIIFQDQIQTFKGVLRLLQVNYYGGFQGRVEYEVSVFGSLVGLNVALSGELLEDIDFSAYNHVYNDANIVASWDNPGGSGYYYPLIDYGTYSTGKHDWDIRTFRPALYVREYIDKMVTTAGYRWNAPLFYTPRFKSLIVPHSKKQLTVITSELYDASNNTQQVYTFTSASPPPSIPISFNTRTGGGFSPDGTFTVYTYSGSVTTTIKIKFRFAGSFQVFGFFPSVVFAIYKNGESGTNLYWSGTAVVATPFDLSGEITFSIAPNDTIEFRAIGSPNEILTLDISEWQATTLGGSIAVPVPIGGSINMNECIPQNIRQIDFLVGIVKLFNLYVYEDKFDERLIYITPYVDFYSKNFSNAVDWTHKLNNDKPIKSKPMSELNAKIYKFKFKSDSDYYNELYRKRYNEGYGDRIYDSEFEFAQKTNEFEIVFSSTPLVGYGGEDKVYSTIFKQTGNAPSVTEENVDSNIRILQAKKIIGVTLWNIKDGSNILNTLTMYGYAGHLDDPDVPATDINFGSPKELFFILTAGSLSDNQFNAYWSNYMREITDKDSKLIVGSFYLTAKDILNLDFSKYIYIDGIAYRLNGIKDFDVTNPNDCQVELFKVNSASYSEAPSNEGPPEGCFLLWSDENTLDYDDGEELLYGDCNTNPGDGDPPPPDTYYLNWSFTKVATGVYFGVMRIYVNGDLQVYASSNNSGSFIVNAGDSIQVDVAGSVSKTKNLLITDSVDGPLFTDSGTAPTITHTFVVAANRDYDATGTITN